MKKRYIPLLIVAVILIGGVALGVHLLHRDALADTFFSVRLWDPRTQTPVEGVDVHISVFDLNADPDEWVELEVIWVEGGFYTAQTNLGASQIGVWETWFDDEGGDLVPLVPNVNPVEGLNPNSPDLYWEVEDNR
jgi:hypothetical protein